MMEIVGILLGNPVFWGVLLAVIFVAVGFIVLKTKTKKDDEIWHALTGIATHAFNVAEKFIPDGSPGTLGKIDMALKIFNEEYSKRNGKLPDEDILSWAKDEWAILSNEAKKN